ncbi:unnamed protein product [Polarella glacialis]|uniref:Major facilitator superfamily associated domain-containing protein n=1 Tax=Polarella glacialis TaxID=89957 RepID=A0A813LE63_POLGL|nr:unnamed protein product [Polarella glacialis]
MHGDEDATPEGDSPVAVHEIARSADFPLARVKAFYFVSFAYFATYHRFLTLYFEADGLSATQIGLLIAGGRTLGLLTAPFVNGLADKTKRARTILQVSLLASVLPMLCLTIPTQPGMKFFARCAAFWAFAIVSTPQNSMRDALALAACSMDVDSWGKARVYGAVGWGIMHLIMGPLLDLFGFSVIFVSFFFLSGLCFLVTRSSVPEACGPVQTEVTARAVLEILMRNKWFFMNIVAIGAGFSMVEGMLFLLLREMKASTMLCGLSVVVTVVFELPIFSYAKSIVARLGTRNMILLGQAAWVVRALFYACMSVPWTVLLIEPLHGVTFALVWTAALQHIADPQVAGEGLEASAQGLLTMCFGGIGPMIGLFFGGLLFDKVGNHAVYAIFAVAVLSAGMIYATLGRKEPTCYGTSTAKIPERVVFKQLPLGRDTSGLDIDMNDLEEPERNDAENLDSKLRA